MFISTSLIPTPAALTYHGAIEHHEMHEPFRSFGKEVVTVFVHALETCGVVPTKDQLMRAITTQGGDIQGSRLEPDVAEALGQIRRHDKIHFQAMICSTVAAINTDC